MFNYVNNIAPEATANKENNDKPKLKPTATVSKPAKIDDSVQVKIQQYQEENQQAVIVHQPDLPPPRQILPMQKSPRTTTLTVGIPNINKGSGKKFCSKQMYAK